jgi:methyl-accepting chemotaxis protein
MAEPTPTAPGTAPTPTTAPTAKRRQYFIDRKFQGVFMLKFFLVLLLGALLTIVITMLTTRATLTSSFDGGRLLIEKTSLAILPSVVFTSVITTLVVGLAALVVTLLVSHKIAGPMFRFKKDIEEISAGNLQKSIKIREGDQFGAVADNLNQMVGTLNSRLREVQSELARLSTAAAEQKLPQAFVDDLEACRKRIDDKFRL